MKRDASGLLAADAVGRVVRAALTLARRDKGQGAADRAAALEAADVVDPVAVSTPAACLAVAVVAEEAAADGVVAVAVWALAGADRTDATGVLDGVRSTASTPALETGGAPRPHSKDRWP